MSKKKYKGKSKASVEADKKKSLSDIQKVRAKLDSLTGRESENSKLSPIDTIEINKAVYDLNKNKVLIEDTSRGTPSQKTSTWSRKPRQNRSILG